MAGVEEGNKPVLEMSYESVRPAGDVGSHLSQALGSAIRSRPWRPPRSFLSGLASEPLIVPASEGPPPQLTSFSGVQAEGADEGCITFVLHEEDHTLGNSLRYLVMKNPDIEFCGYSITHPSESKINFRIQTRGGVPAVEPFRKGLNDLTDVCQHVLNTFQARVKDFKGQAEAMD